MEKQGTISYLYLLKIKENHIDNLKNENNRCQYEYCKANQEGMKYTFYDSNSKSHPYQELESIKDEHNNNKSNLLKLNSVILYAHADYALLNIEYNIALHDIKDMADLAKDTIAKVSDSRISNINNQIKKLANHTDTNDKTDRENQGIKQIGYSDTSYISKANNEITFFDAFLNSNIRNNTSDLYIVADFIEEKLIELAKSDNSFMENTLTTMNKIIHMSDSNDSLIYTNKGNSKIAISSIGLALITSGHNPDKDFASYHESLILKFADALRESYHLKSTYTEISKYAQSEKSTLKAIQSATDTLEKTANNTEYTFNEYQDFFDSTDYAIRLWKKESGYFNAISRINAMCIKIQSDASQKKQENRDNVLNILGICAIGSAVWDILCLWEAPPTDYRYKKLAIVIFLILFISSLYAFGLPTIKQYWAKAKDRINRYRQIRKTKKNNKANTDTVEK